MMPDKVCALTFEILDEDVIGQVIKFADLSLITGVLLLLLFLILSSWVKGVAQFSQNS